MTPTNVHKHIDETYFYLRIGLALLAFSFPFVLLFVGRYVHGIPIQENMSAYYFAFAPEDSALRVFPMRDWFVGILWAVGCFLILYRGLSRPENWILNLAGFSALCIALLPTEPPKYCEIDKIQVCGEGWPMAHWVSSVVLFACIAFVAWVFRWQTVELLSDKRLRDRFGNVYSAIAIAMAITPLAATGLSFGIGPPFRAAALVPDLFSWTLYIEIFGVGLFAIFWLIKTWELYLIDSQPPEYRLQAGRGALTDEESKSVSMTLNKWLTRSD